MRGYGAEEEEEEEEEEEQEEKERNIKRRNGPRPIEVSR